MLANPADKAEFGGDDDGGNGGRYPKIGQQEREGVTDSANGGHYAGDKAPNDGLSPPR